MILLFRCESIPTLNNLNIHASIDVRYNHADIKSQRSKTRRHWQDIIFYASNSNLYSSAIVRQKWNQNRKTARQKKRERKKQNLNKKEEENSGTMSKVGAKQNFQSKGRLKASWEALQIVSTTVLSHHKINDIPNSSLIYSCL